MLENGTRSQLQKDFVFNSTIQVLSLNGVIKKRDQTVRSLVTKIHRRMIRQRLFKAFREGKIPLSVEKDDRELARYCSVLLANWLRKDSRFNVL